MVVSRRGPRNTWGWRMNVRGVVEVDRMTRGQGRGFRILKRFNEVVQGDGKSSGTFSGK